ncbi:MAG: corrinoid protein [Chloroflexi bacterium]|nr:corrinoid protein [Chloroflexota bacterium]
MRRSDVNLSDLQAAVINGNAKSADALARAGLAEGLAPMTIITEALVPGMHEVGERFKREEYFVPEMLLSARAMKTALAIVKPLLIQQGGLTGPKVAIGTVQGDLHDIGKNLVAMMLEGAGFEILDLGTNVKPEQFVRAVAEQGAQVIAMSALLTTTMTNMPATVEALKSAGVRDRTVVMIGGAPVTERYAQQIGADGFAADAATAVEVAQARLRARIA